MLTKFVKQIKCLQNENEKKESWAVHGGRIAG